MTTEQFPKNIRIAHRWCHSYLAKEVLPFLVFCQVIAFFFAFALWLDYLSPHRDSPFWWAITITSFSLLCGIPELFWFRAYLIQNKLRELTKRPDLRIVYLPETAPEKHAKKLERKRKEEYYRKQRAEEAKMYKVMGKEW